MRTTGINHMALVCRDMQETVKFYTEVLDMPLVKTVARSKAAYPSPATKSSSPREPSLHRCRAW